MGDEKKKVSYEVQYFDEQSGEWDTLEDECGDEVFDTYEEARSLLLYSSDEYPVTDMRIVDSNSEDFI